MTDRDDTSESGARQRAMEAYESATDTLGQAPLLVLAGGLAAGALIAALLPRTEAESRLVRPTARRVRDTASVALKAAKDTGSDRLDELGLSRDKAEETVRSLLDGLTDAAKASANAALEAARNADNG